MAMAPNTTDPLDGGGMVGPASTAMQNLRNHQNSIEDALSRHDAGDKGTPGIEQGSQDAKAAFTFGTRPLWMNESSATPNESDVRVPESIAKIPEHDPSRHLLYLYHVKQAAGTTVCTFQRVCMQAPVHAKCPTTNQTRGYKQSCILFDELIMCAYKYVYPLLCTPFGTTCIGKKSNVHNSNGCHKIACMYRL